jgi:ubiquitin-like 1-activating enzyme E1 B
LKKEAEALKGIKAAMGTSEFAAKVFEKVFNTDIHRLLSMADMWKSRKPPTPLSFLDYKTTLPTSERSPAEIAGDDQKIWSLRDNIDVFKLS